MTAQTVAERAEILAPTGLAPLLTSDQLRAYFGISLWTVNEWRKAGCPMQRIPGGRRRFNLAAVQTWLAAQDAEIAESRAEVVRKAVAART
ncbi:MULTISPECIES: terminase small subunit [unclassified Streptomyces]|uniref:terminase small subunit n=1 Tax=unclassified Streptomyces TaxID=2593676 RepID=UPI0033E9E423